MENHSNLSAVHLELLFDLQSSVYSSIEALRLFLLLLQTREKEGPVSLQQDVKATQELDGAKRERET